MTTTRTITEDEVAAHIEAGTATLVEALPRANYDNGHLPGALSLPHDQVDELAPELLPDKDAAIVVYCANSPCPNSGMAARRLTELGYRQVSDYDAGKEAWVTSGGELEA